MSAALTRDRLTWTAYVVLGWFAYLQAAPGLVVTHLRRELDLSYSTAGLYTAAFAGGSLLAGVLSARLERALGRRTMLWSAAALMAAGAVGLTAGTTAVATVGSVLTMGLGGGLVLATIQAMLADHHGELRTVALAEVNVAASIGYVAVVGALSLAAWVGAGWRGALLVSLAVPALAWWRTRPLEIDAPPAPPTRRGERLPGVFWIASAILVCTTAVEWTVTGWGATFAGEAADVSADTAVSLMAAYFGGVVVGRVLGSRLAFRVDPARLLALALTVTATGFAILWTSTAPVQATLGLALLGVGIGNLFPMALSVAVGLLPGRSQQASGRAVAASSSAILLAPLVVGTLADATSLKAALCVVPVMLVLAGGALALLRGARPG